MKNNRNQLEKKKMDSNVSDEITQLKITESQDDSDEIENYCHYITFRTMTSYFYLLQIFLTFR